MQSIDSIETYAYGTSKDLVSKKEEIKCNNIIIQWEMINFDDVTTENIKEHNINWHQIPDHLYRILIIGGSGSGKTNLLFNSIRHTPYIDKFFLYAKDPFDTKYQLLINKKESKVQT